MKIEHLKGLIAAPFTPMDAQGEVNLEVIPSYYAFLKNNGVNGAFICGSTGEGVSMTVDEKLKVAEAWAACTAGDPDFKVMTLLAGNALKDCLCMARHARSLGLHAVSFTSPSYFKPAKVQVLADMCTEIAAEVPEMAFYYYHVPVLTGVNFPMTDLLEAVAHRVPNFAGIKYTHEDFMDYQTCMNFRNGHYDMLWGRDENMLSALILGAKGAVGSTFNYIAPLYHELSRAFNEGDFKTAQQLQQRSIDFIRLLGRYGGISTGKFYMRLAGINCGQFRLPVKSMAEQQFAQFREEVYQLDFDKWRSVWPQALQADSK